MTRRGHLGGSCAPEHGRDQAHGEIVMFTVIKMPVFQCTLTACFMCMHSKSKSVWVNERLI